MKLYQKIMLFIFLILAVCGGICGWVLGMSYEKRQISEAAFAELQSYESAKYTMEWIFRSETAAENSREITRLIIKQMFAQEIFEGYLWLEDGKVVCDSSDYEIIWNPDWKTKGKFEETEYVMEQGEGEYRMVIGSRLPWLGEGDYLFSVRDLTEIHGEAEDLLRQFAFIWFFFMTAASLFVAAAVKLVLKPVGTLERAAMEVSRGNYSIRVHGSRRDETGKLAEAFNVMAGQVEERIQELTRAGEEKERLLGSLAHEMRTPMTSIVGYSDTLLHVKLGEREKQRALQNIYEQAGYLQRLSAKLMELIALHQNESISMEKHSAKAILEKALRMAERRWPDREFVLCAKTDFSLQGDADLLVSLFVNFLDNGAKASLPGQEIRGGIPQAGTVFVRDFGKGMEEEELTKIREPFYRKGGPAGENGGLGLGLSICQQIACLHGADLQIESRKGRGTKVSLYFYNSFTE
ncbi:MAG: HAMP domain-containing histidine kinase [Lachnospiraceae bacterium]|nr:HAMP domain-containing histidine kinase [Lachnospiraceae bacterium]